MVRPNKAFFAVTLIALVLLGGRSSAQRPAFVSGEILVTFRPGAAASAKADAHGAGGGSPASEIERTRVQRVRVPAGEEFDAIDRYRRNPNVLSAEPNFVRTLGAESGGPLIPGDFSFGQTWGLNNTGQQFYCFGPFCFYSGTPDADIDAPEAWAITTGSADVTVAVIDSGIDYTHPDLAPNYAGGHDFVTPDSDPMDDHGHGTHVSGTIAAALNNLTGSPGAAEGVAGVAPRARILSYKVCRADGSCDDFAIQQAIAQAITAGASVINMSLGESAYSQSLDAAVQDAWNAGLVIVAGAGNNGTTELFYPAALPNVISVAAFDEDHRRPSFSNYGSWVDISAPGSNILSTYPMSACSASTTPGDVGCYAFNTGTSMATPHVAGAAALLWSQMSSNGQVVDALLSSADGSGVGGIRLDSWTMHGGLNVHAALTHSVTRPVAKAGADQTLTDSDENGVESVTLDGSASFDPNGTIVSYVWREGSTTIGSGASTVVSLPVGFHTVTLQVTDNDGEIGTDAVTIAVHPPRQVTVTAPTPQATEAGPSPGMFRVSRTGDASAPLTVLYKVEGTAGAGTDYQALSGQVTIDSGYDSADIAVTPLNDSAAEANETVVVTILAHSGYYLGLPFSASVTIVSDDVPADLIVSAMAAPTTAGAGKLFTVTETTKNQGAGDGGDSTTRFYLSTNSSLDGADLPLGSRTVPPLAAGVSNAVTTSLTVPEGTATGTYYVIAQADTANAVVETSESNNNRSSSAVRIGPDLVVSAVTAPATAAAGSTFMVTETTKNQGDGDSAASTTRFYLSVNSSLDSADVILGTRAVPPTAADASDTATTSLMMPEGTAAGSYYVIAQADAANAVVETVESNNLRASSAAMKVGPDLVVSAMTAPGSAANGATITVTDTTRNQGTGPAAPSSTGYYLSTNSTIGSGDVFLGSRSVGALAPGASATGSASVQIPLDTAPDFYYIVARADWNSLVGETSETKNDRASGTVKIGGDLVVTGLAAPTTGMANGPITITDTTTNSGTTAMPASVTGFYLSLNSSHDANDIFLGSRNVGPLGASQADSGSTQAVIPAGTASASYFVLGIADYDRVLPEINETNNTKAIGTLRVGPDVTVSAITAPSTAAAGTSISAGDTTRNIGADTMPASVTSFYLSTNSTIDATDVLLGSRSVSSLAPGASETGSLPVVIPATTAAGTYYIVAKADGPNATVEPQENNNTRLRSISITAAP